MTTIRKAIGSTWVTPIESAKPQKKTARGRLRQAGAEIVQVLRSSASKLTCRQFYRALPHVPGHALRRHLTEMSSAGYLERVELQSRAASAGERGGRPHTYAYGLSGTMVST